MDAGYVQDILQSIEVIDGGETKLRGSVTSQKVAATAFR